MRFAGNSVAMMYKVFLLSLPCRSLVIIVKFLSKPDYMSTAMVRRLIVPLMFAYMLFSINNLLGSNWQTFGYSGGAFIALLIAFNSLHQRRHYWVIPLVVAFFPSGVILLGLSQFPTIGGYWSLASIFFYFVSMHYRFAWIPLVLLLPFYTFFINAELGTYIAMRYVVCYCLMVYFLFLFTREIVQAFGEAKYLAENDHLTGLSNRRVLINAVQKWFDYNQRAEQSKVTLALIDLDYFKQLNDNFGHQAGDNALKEFSTQLKNSIRKTDVVGRYGGEEFLVVLPDTDEQGAKQVLQTLRTKLNTLERKDLPLISFSSGIASLGQDRSYSDWIHRADEALYQAKHNGRAVDVIALQKTA